MDNMLPVPTLDFDYGKTDKNLPLFFYDTDGDFAVSSYSVNKFPLQLWMIDEESHRPVLAHNTDELTSLVAISNYKGRVVSFFSGNNTLTLWQIQDNKLNKVISQKMNDGFLHMALSPNGERILLEDGRGSLFVYEMAQDKFDIVASQHEKNGGFFHSILGDTASDYSNIKPSKRAFHPNQDAFIRGDGGGVSTSFLIHSGKIAEVYKQKIFEKSGIRGLIFTSEYSLMVLAANGAIESWQWSNGMLSDGQVLKPGSNEETKFRTSARFSISSDGEKVISRDLDGTTLLWKLKSGRWSIAKELIHPQQAGYQDAFFSHNVPMLWSTDKEMARAITKY
jgi:WD40 repeat protein